MVIKLKNIILNISFIVIIFIVFTGMLEVLFRSTHLFGASISFSGPDPIFYFRFTPGSQYWRYKENDHPITGKINKYGYRDKNWTLEKPKNIFRIAVLGDSYVEAFEVVNNISKKRRITFL